MQEGDVPILHENCESFCAFLDHHHPCSGGTIQLNKLLDMVTHAQTEEKDEGAFLYNDILNRSQSLAFRIGL